ncbi:hexose kinase [Microbacterium sp. gxy059]|uniref:hexose kinase n=1 Tax=Microbacterium sp. gxy059 TaxID=2957199 RepID=UPI003D9655D5
MIITLTANPSLDRTVQLPAPLAVGEVQAAASIREDAGGKGVNVARVLHAAGDAVTGILPLAEDDPYAHALGALPVRAVAASGRVRANLAITDPAGTTTKLNLPGAPLGAPERAALIDAVADACAEGAAWLALCGSLPPGAGDGFYVDVIRAVRERVAAPPRIAVDTSGPALAAVVADGRPDLITPNEIELAELSGLALDAGAPLAEAVARVARALVPERVGAVLVTLGGDGAVLADADGALAASVPTGISVRSTVGAGDSALAGFLHAHAAGASADERLRQAVRFGSATAALPGTQLATPSDLPDGPVAVRPLDIDV